jgi:CheY-like chemotaxis protein
MTRAGCGLVQSLRSEALPKRYVERRLHLSAATQDRPDRARPAAGGDAELSAVRPSSMPQSLVGLTVVVVDDDEASLDYFAMALRTAGAVVATASTMLDAVRIVREQRPDVVLSDIAMPGQDGYWLVREMRRFADPALRRVPVVATTAYGRVHSRERALAEGFVDHLAKPVEPELLCVTIARVAGR